MDTTNKVQKQNQIKIIRKTLTDLKFQHKVDMYRIERFETKLKYLLREV